MQQASLRKDWYELLSSMRFAISLLTVLAIASVVGTVLRQNEPYTNYAAQFGPFWFAVFEALGLYDVYHSGWFLAILLFLVISTSLCVYRNTPGMLREMRGYREKATEASLRSFAHKAEFPLPPGPDATSSLTQYLAGRGFQYRIAQPATGTGQVLIAAKAGSYHRLGYILTHTAIVVICLGGLLDGNVPLKAQELLGLKKIETRDIPQSQVPPESRLPPSNLSFRGNVTVPEGASVDVVFQNVADGYLVQELPFTIHLKKFHIDHYSTGQPRTFASDLVVTDKASGAQVETTIEVNRPLIFNGVAIYQASFGDGGSRLKLRAWDLVAPEVRSVDLEAQVNQAVPFVRNQAQYSVELTDFRPFNIENFTAPPQDEPAESGLLPALVAKLPSSVPGTKDFRNLGPSFQFKLRDAQGQAREFSNYMLPVQLDGRWYFLSGVRASPNESFRFMRIPADEAGGIDGYMRLRAVLFDSAAHREVARRFVAAAVQGAAIGETLRDKLRESTERVLQIFASRGFEALAGFIEKAVPEAEREKAAQTYLKLLEGAALEAYQFSRERSGLPRAPLDENTMRFVRDSLTSFSDAFLYGAPAYFQLLAYDEVKASGLQLTRSPGKNIVYGGSVLLVLGVFAMFYIRERRLWLLVKPQSGKLLLAMSSNRKTVDFEREFRQHSEQIARLLQVQP